MSESHIVWTLMLDWDVIVEHYGFTNLQAMCDLCLKMTVTLSWDLFEIAVFGYCFGIWAATSEYFRREIVRQKYKLLFC